MALPILYFPSNTAAKTSGETYLRSECLPTVVSGRTSLSPAMFWLSIKGLSTSAEAAKEAVTLVLEDYRFTCGNLVLAKRVCARSDFTEGRRTKAHRPSEKKGLIYGLRASLTGDGQRLARLSCPLEARFFAEGYSDRSAV